ncbi:pilus assembly protein [Streptomyces sp. GD-15H]|uniref:pilus assembly protein n=1 Tax=Streptomyces sp. GD-15H TaxID=3129112 RepID=UPI003255925C
MRMRAIRRARDRVRNRVRDRGQVTIEFLGMTPAILVTLVVLWQLVLVGYTFTLAGNAADEAVRAGTASERAWRQSACREAGLDKLPDAWKGAATVNCTTAGGFVTAEVKLNVPVLFPGTADFPFDVTGSAGAVEEVD